MRFLFSFSVYSTIFYEVNQTECVIYRYTFKTVKHEMRLKWRNKVFIFRNDPIKRDKQCKHRKVKSKIDEGKRMQKVVGVWPRLLQSIDLKDKKSNINSFHPKMRWDLLLVSESPIWQQELYQTSWCQNRMERFSVDRCTPRLIKNTANLNPWKMGEIEANSILLFIHFWAK